MVVCLTFIDGHVSGPPPWVITGAMVALSIFKASDACNRAKIKKRAQDLVTAFMLNTRSGGVNQLLVSNLFYSCSLLLFFFY